MKLALLVFVLFDVVPRPPRDEGSGGGSCSCSGGNDESDAGGGL